MSKLSRLYHTLRPLRWRQWWYRLWHPLVKRFAAPTSDIPNTASRWGRPQPALLSWQTDTRYDPQHRSFMFLNRKVSFGTDIDWHYSAEGPLWAFNLHYFEWLYDDRLSVADRLETVAAFCHGTKPGRRMHLYPASLRIMAWIWFDARYGVLNAAQRSRLFADADWLRRFPEYQLDGNHLFENAIALCTAGIYFDAAALLRPGEQLLKECIRDQVLHDGGHCEGSPMYHSLLLWRLMQCLDLARLTDMRPDLVALLTDTAERMLGWLQAVTFSDGTWPAVNDAVAGIAPQPATLLSAAKDMNLRVPATRLGDSGYRMIRTAAYELFIDVGGIQPSWQPGHAHADTGSFCLHVGGKPVIVDTGCSTYENRAVRLYERGTKAHNTVCIDGADSSELWSRFRLGKRVYVNSLHEESDSISLQYVDAAGIVIRRSFSWNGSGLEIRDRGLGTSAHRVAAIHFHPDHDITKNGIADLIQIECKGIEERRIVDTKIAGGFNILLPSACLLLDERSDDVVIRIGVLCE